MCKILEDMRAEAAYDKAVEMAQRMLEDNLPIDKVVLYTGLSLEEAKNLQNSRVV